jgi:hypothetical protein
MLEGRTTTDVVKGLKKEAEEEHLASRRMGGYGASAGAPGFSPWLAMATLMGGWTHSRLNYGSWYDLANGHGPVDAYP